MGERFVMKLTSLIFLIALAMQNSPAQEQIPRVPPDWVETPIVPTAPNSPAQKPHDSSKTSDAFAKAELLALQAIEIDGFEVVPSSNESFTTSSQAARDAADAEVVTSQERLISTLVQQIYNDKYLLNYPTDVLKKSRTLEKEVNGYSSRLSACIWAEEDALRKRSVKLPRVCNHDVIWTPMTKEEMAADNRKIQAEMRATERRAASVAANDPARQLRPESAPSRKDIPSIAKAANGSVVSVVMSDKDGHAIAQGTGFLVSKDGLTVTNYHVIAEGSSAIVKLPDGAFFFVDGVLAFDKARDVAVIKAHGENFRTLSLGNSDRVQVGEEVVAIGNPLLLESTVSNGIVSGIRTVEEQGGKFLQVTAPISPGSSGGPLFNMAGEVVGITTLYLKGGENLNFAIPINDAKPLLEVDSAKLQNFPNEPESTKTQKQTHAEDASPAAPVAAVKTPATARDYYQQLFDAGGFSRDSPDYVCFSDTSNSGTFFTFKAYAYNADYYNAQTKVQAGVGQIPVGNSDTYTLTPEGKQLFDTMKAVQSTAPYINFLMKGWLESFHPKLQQFFRSGGRGMEVTFYEKGIKSNMAVWLWDGSSWSHPLEMEHPNAITQVYTVYKLSIEPTTMRYARSGTVTITAGSGETAATQTDRYGPWGGVCEKVPNPK